VGVDLEVYVCERKRTRERNPFAVSPSTPHPLDELTTDHSHTHTLHMHRKH